MLDFFILFVGFCNIALGGFLIWFNWSRKFRLDILGAISFVLGLGMVIAVTAEKLA